MATSSDFIIRKGNVGINDPKPNAKLHVSGSVRIDGNIGSAPSTQSAQTLGTAYGEDPTEYLAQPNLWLQVNIDGTDYVIPAYLPA